MLFRIPDIVIEVRPIGGGKFAVKHAGRLLIGSTATPFCDAARRLLAEGFPPGSVLGMRHQGKADIALRGKLGHAARLTVREDESPPRFARWKASPYRAVSAPMRLFGQAVPLYRTAPRRRILGGVR